MEIREVRAFTAVAEQGSLSGAARGLHVSQSALSQTILSLERQLGVRLLVRHSTGVTVTDAGMILLREGRALPAQHDRALAAVTNHAAGSRASELAGPAGVRLHQLASLDWVAFPRAEASAWYGEVAAILRTHGITVPEQPPNTGDHPLIAEVKFAAVVTGRAFALAPPRLSAPLPEGVTWCPLIGAPIVRRTWAVWPDSSRRRDVATLVAALDITTR